MLFCIQTHVAHKGFFRKHLSLVLTVVGVFLLGFVGSEYYGMYREQKRLTQEWEQQNVPTTDANHPRPAADGLTRVEIPKINLDAIVVEGASRKQLKLGPGRITTSAHPGEVGNSVITAHRDTFFRHIYELTKGDDILIRRNGEVFRYRVTGKKIVDPSDLSVLKQTKDAQLTLITCYPTYFIGPAPERLVIFSKLESGPGSQETSSTVPLSVR
ncbi:MAG TPA: class D sortase [Terriglobales bacterium]|nr:class D sortase [Terriglobales bacterium]